MTRAPLQAIGRVRSLNYVKKQAPGEEPLDPCPVPNRLSDSLRFLRYPPPHGLRRAALTFGFQAFSDGSPRPLGRHTIPRHVEGVRQQLDQCIFSDSSISGLRSLATPSDTKSTVTGQAVAPFYADPPFLLPGEQPAGLKLK